MGVAASLFFVDGDVEKQTLFRRITLSSEQFESQQEIWNELADFLIAFLKENTGYPIRTWLQGSYKFGTQVRPARKGQEFDIDLGVFFCWESFPEDEGICPPDLKNKVQDGLIDFKHEEKLEVLSPPKERCSRIRFSQNFHIDVPCYHLSIERDDRSLATASGEWESSDPKRIYVWFKEKFSEMNRKKVRRYIKYLKEWSNLKFEADSDRPSSTLITILVSEAVLSLDVDDLKDDDDSLVAIVDLLVRRLEEDSRVLNPASDDEEDLASRLSESAYDEFLEKLNELKSIGEEAISCTDPLEAADCWTRVFEHFFPMPEDSDDAARDFAGSVFFRPEIRVRATSQANKARTWTGINEIGPIPKECDIEFSLQNHGQLPQGATVQWIVRNGGSEAEDSNDLGHLAGVGERAEEKSAYHGVHSMDCMVHLGSAVLGYRRVPVRITGAVMPGRNPKARPAWTKLRGRR